MVSDLLKQAFEEAEKLSVENQGVLAEQIFEFISEIMWLDLFAKSHDMLEKMAQKALEDYQNERTTPIDCYITDNSM